ncbi:MAG: hypothetical protein ABIO48_12660 [Pedococcus sp.]
MRTTVPRALGGLTTRTRAGPSGVSTSMVVVLLALVRGFAEGFVEGFAGGVLAPVVTRCRR